MMASARTLPASIIERASGIEQGTTSTPPATMSCKPGAAPFEGTQGSALGSTPWSFRRPAIARCQMPPWPVPEAFNFPGLDLIAAIKAGPGELEASGTGQGGIWHLAIAGARGLQLSGARLD